MSLRIGDLLMTSSVTGHTARRETGQRWWSVTWLGHRQLTRNQAVTALTLAEFVAAGAVGPAHRDWATLRTLAAELGLTADNAVYLIKESQ